MKKVVLITIISLTSTVSVAGLSYKFFNKGNQEDISAIDEEDPLYKNLIIDKPSTGSPNDYDPIENLFIAQGVYVNSKYKAINTDGVCQAVVYSIKQNQKVKNRKIVNDNESFSEAISNSSIVHVAKQKFVTDKDYLVRDGKSGKIKEDSAEYNKVYALSKKKYLELFGALPFDFTNYVLNRESVGSFEIIDTSDNFVCKYNLNVDIACAKYQRETKTMAGSNSLPKFFSSSIIVTMDKNWVVSKVEQNDVYDINIMGDVRCTSNMNNIYTYQSEPFNIPERKDFEPFFGTIPPDDDTNVTKEKTSQDYLMDGANSLLNNENGINIGGKININNKDISLNAFINLSKQIIKVNLNDKLTLYYQDKNVYFNYGKVFAQIPYDEIVDVASLYLGVDFGSFDISSLLANENVSSALETMTSKKEDNKLTLSINMFPFVVDINMKIDENDVASFEKVNFGLSVNEISIDGSIMFNTSAYNYRSIPKDVELLTNISDNIESIQEFIKRKDFALDYDLSIENIRVFGEAYLNIDGEQVNFTSDAHLVYNDEEFVFNVKYFNNYVYLNYEDSIKLKLSIDEAKDLLYRIDEMLSLNLFNQENVFDKSVLENVDFSNILQYISCSSDGLSASINLEEFGLNQILDLKYEPGKKVSLDIAKIGHVYLSSSEHQEIASEEGSYLTYDDIVSYLDIIDSLLTSKSMTLSLDFGFISGDTQIDIIGEVRINILDGNVPLKDKIAVDFNVDLYLNNNYLTNVDGTYLNNKLTLQLLNKNIVLSYEEIKDIVYYTLDTFNLSQDLSGIFSLLENEKIDLSGLSCNSIKGIIDLITLVSKDIKINLNNTNLIISPINEKELDVSLGEGNLIKVTINEKRIPIESLNVEGDLSCQDIKNLIKATKTIIDNIDQRDFAISFSSSINDIKLDGNVYLHIDEVNAALNVDGKVLVSYQNQIIEVDVKYLDNYIYLSYEDNIGIKLTVDELLNLINDSLAKFNKEPIAINFEFSLENLIFDLMTDENKVGIDLDLTNYNLDHVQVDYLYNDGVINVNHKLINASVTLSSEKSISLNQQINYLVYEDLNEYLVMAFNYYDNQTIELNNIDLAFNSNGITIAINGRAYLAIRNKGLYLDGQFDVYVSNIKISADVTLIDNVLYLGLGNFDLVLSVDEFAKLLDEIELAFDIDLQFVKDYLSYTDLSNISSLVDMNNLSLDFNQLLRSVNTSNDKLSLTIPVGKDNLNLSIDKLGNVLLSIDNIGVISCNYLEGYYFEAPDYKFALTYDELSQLVSIASDAYSYRKYESFTFGFTGSAQDVSYNGDLMINLKSSSEDISTKYIDEFKVDLYAKENTLGRSHDIDLIYSNETAYVNYNNNTKAHIDKISALQLIADINNLTLKNEFIASLLKDMTVDNKVDILSYYQKGESGYICINDLIKSLSIVQKQINLQLMINNEVYYIVLGSDDNHLLSANVSCSKMNLNIVNSALSSNIITPTIDNTWLDFSSLDELVDMVINTINLREYYIEKTDASVNLSLGIIKTDVKASVQIDAMVDENNKPLLIIQIAITDSKAMIAVDGKTYSTIIYDGQNIYCKRVTSTTEYNIWTTNDFFNDATNKIFYILNLKKYIISLITTSKANDGNNKYMDFDQIIQTYKFENAQYTLDLNSVELFQNQNINSFHTVIGENLEKKIISNAHIEMKLVKVITLQADLVLLDNATASKDIFITANDLIIECQNNVVKA